ncbi:CMD domain protein [Pantoea sp. 18069]|uniref:CMD domain protein n=1 Tax=Pantoea sp. 18069 TaxID=2681415 RepID=UPI001357068B|nr:CMD domain protein [Pantoea sp. 18069]
MTAPSHALPDPQPAPADVIDQLLNILPGDALDRIRAQRPQARIHAQQSYLSLFHPAAPVVGRVSALERHALAWWVATLHTAPDVAGFHAQALQAAGADQRLLRALELAADTARGQGPYGHYPAGPLSVENQGGPVYALESSLRAVLGDKLAAAFEQAHLLVFHPRDASPAGLQALLDAGWDTTDIVILSQLVAFLSFQIRVVLGLRALQAHPSTAAARLETA